MKLYINYDMVENGGFRIFFVILMSKMGKSGITTNSYA